MNLKRLVGLSLIMFATSAGLILFVGLVLLPPAPKTFVTDPATGQQVATSGDQTAAGLPDSAGPSTPTAAAGQTTVAPGGAATPKAGTTATPTSAVGAKTPTPAPGGGGTPTPVRTPTPTAAPTPTPAPTYCSGRTPCYGPSALAQHGSTGNCWGYNLDWVINLTNFAPNHPNGPQNIQASSTCGKNIAGALNGSVSVNGTHNHTSTTKNNGAGSALASYRVGYYDASKP